MVDGAQCLYDGIERNAGTIVIKPLVTCKGYLKTSTDTAHGCSDKPDGLGLFECLKVSSMYSRDTHNKGILISQKAQARCCQISSYFSEWYATQNLGIFISATFHNIFWMEDDQMQG